LTSLLNEGVAVQEINETGFRRALIVGAGSGLSASLARLLARHGMRIALAARNTEKLAALCGETGAAAFAADATKIEDVDNLFEDVRTAIGPPDVVIYNASGRLRGEFAALDPQAVKDVILQTAYGGFLVAHHAVGAMLKQGRGAIFFTGASASVKGYAKSAPFAMGKFALRGLAQSMARELAPKGIHVAHFVIDGRIGSASVDDTSILDPDAISETYLHILRQPRSAWTWEVELRPSVETF
jgi:NAD(P)-dependent dehydrogenase (short-subunit alcohol dehydrogenase family)